MNSLQSLFDNLNGGQLVEQLVLPQQQGEIDHMLDQRDAEEFSSRWMQAFREVESLKSAFPLLSDDLELVTQLRENAYMKAFKRWKSPDLAACISDDLGLIGDAFATKAKFSWIDELLKSYLKGIIPSGKLPTEA